MDERRHNMDGALFVDDEQTDKAREARPHAERHIDDEKADDACRVTQSILDRMDLDARVSIREDDERVVLDIDGPDAGRAIGKKGMTLEALQFLVNKIVNRDPDERRHIVLDSGDYRDRHDSGLVAMAKREAKRAVSSGRAVTLEPMSARDRRVIHVSLAKFPGVSTRSEGEGAERRLQIIPARGGSGREREDPPRERAHDERPRAHDDRPRERARDERPRAHDDRPRARAQDDRPRVQHAQDERPRHAQDERPRAQHTQDERPRVQHPQDERPRVQHAQDERARHAQDERPRVQHAQDERPRERAEGPRREARPRASTGERAASDRPQRPRDTEAATAGRAREVDSREPARGQDRDADYDRERGYTDRDYADRNRD